MTTEVWRHPPWLWLWLSIAAAVLAAAGNVIGLVAVDRIYGDEYPSGWSLAISVRTLRAVNPQ